MNNNKIMGVGGGGKWGDKETTRLLLVQLLKLLCQKCKGPTFY